MRQNNARAVARILIPLWIPLSVGTAVLALPAASLADDGDAPATAPTKAPAKPAAPAAPKAEPKAESAPKAPAAPRGSGAVRSGSRSTEWQLEFKPGALRLYVDPATNANYWYFTYHVTNRSGAERMWAPRFEFFSERGEIKVSGKEVPSRVTDQIMSLLGNPLLEDQNQILGDLLVGEENAKDGVVVWPAGDADVNELTVFVTGASGRVRKVPDAKTGEMKPERWTLRFNYHLPGEAVPRGSKPVEPARADEDVKEGAERRPDDIGVWLWR